MDKIDVQSSLVGAKMEGEGPSDHPQAHSFTKLGLPDTRITQVSYGRSW